MTELVTIKNYDISTAHIALVQSEDKPALAGASKPTLVIDMTSGDQHRILFDSKEERDAARERLKQDVGKPYHRILDTLQEVVEAVSAIGCH